MLEGIAKIRPDGIKMAFGYHCLYVFPNVSEGLIKPPSMKAVVFSYGTDAMIPALLLDSLSSSAHFYCGGIIWYSS